MGTNLAHARAQEERNNARGSLVTNPQPMVARAHLLLSPLALALCAAAFQPALPRAHRPALAQAAASRSTAARLQQPSPSSSFPLQQPRRRKRKRRRTGPEMETMLVKTVALAVAGGALRSVVPAVLPLASLTFAAGLVLRALPTGTIEALLFAMVLSLTGLGNYFPFNFIVWFAGGAGFFMVLYECNVNIERWQRQRRARRSKEAERTQRQREDSLSFSEALEEKAAREPDEREPQEPLGLIVLVIGSLAYSVLGALPGGALLG